MVKILNLTKNPVVLNNKDISIRNVIQIKKKNIGYILFGVAGSDIITGLVSFFVFPRIYENLGIPTNSTKFISIIVLTTSLMTVIILIIIRVILILKFLNEEKNF